MKTIVILAWGSRGDVAPYTGLGLRLQQAGYHVVLAAQHPYRGLITDLGLEFRLLPGDTAQVTRNSESAQRLVDGDRMRPSKAMLAEMTENMRGLGQGFAVAARDADLLLLPAVATVLGYHVAEGLRIPSLGVHLQPTAPTGDFPPAVLGTRSFGRWGNRALAKLGALGEKTYLPLINEVRADLGLAATTVRSYQKQRLAHWPILHGFSEHVVPRPSDWRPGLDITGYWWPPMPPKWTPPADLVDFLSAGPAPVFVGLGSTATTHGRHLSRVVAQALRTAGLRGVVQSGWAGLDGNDCDAITIGDIPHEWLFPQMAAVVHHGGAGTSAAGLRAAVPAVPVTGIMDQPFWAKRLTDLGVAPGFVRRRELDPDTLAGLVTAAVTEPSYRQRAQHLSRLLNEEDGAGRALKAIDTFLNTRETSN